MIKLIIPMIAAQWSRNPCTALRRHWPSRNPLKCCQLSCCTTGLPSERLALFLDALCSSRASEPRSS